VSTIRREELRAALDAEHRDVRTHAGGIDDRLAGDLPVERPRTARLTFAELALGPTASLFEGHRHAGADASIFVTRTPPGRAVGLHGDDCVELEPEQILVVPADTRHGFRNTGDAPLSVVCVHERGTVRTTWLGEPPA
jgi:mannose-6-phosphate isomerase-like protein (cupin superfamily)